MDKAFNLRQNLKSKWKRDRGKREREKRKQREREREREGGKGKRKKEKRETIVLYESDRKDESKEYVIEIISGKKRKRVKQTSRSSV